MNIEKERLTEKDILEIVRNHAEYIVNDAPEHTEDRQPFSDMLFREVDNGLWQHLISSTGMINNMSTYPTTAKQRLDLINATMILQTAKNSSYGWIAQDSGLWENLEGQQVIFSQAFFTLQNILIEVLEKDFNVDYEAWENDRDLT